MFEVSRKVCLEACQIPDRFLVEYTEVRCLMGGVASLKHVLPKYLDGEAWWVGHLGQFWMGSGEIKYLFGMKDYFACISEFSAKKLDVMEQNWLWMVSWKSYWRWQNLCSPVLKYYLPSEVKLVSIPSSSLAFSWLYFPLLLQVQCYANIWFDRMINENQAAALSQTAS